MNGAGHEGRKHCEHSPSSAYRWTACPGSIQLCRKLPAPAPSAYAAEGTMAHEFAEFCLRQGHRPMDYIGRGWYGEIMDAEFCEAVQVYTDYVRELMLDADWVGLEREFYLDSINPPVPMHGTCDFVCLRGTILHVADYKHGAGVVVEVTGNKQMRYYALGAVLSMPEHLWGKAQEVQITTVQPRAYHADGPVRSEAISIVELLDFALDLIAAVDATLAPNPPLWPGDHCRFCAAHAVCPALQQKALELAGKEFFDNAPAPLVNPQFLTNEEVGRLMARFSLVEDWMNAVRTYAFNVLSGGADLPGWKLVPKRATRKWTDEAAVKAWARKAKLRLADIMEAPALLSPAAMEKALGKKMIPEHLVSKVSSGLTLAEASDPRPAVPVISAAEEFSALTK